MALLHQLWLWGIKLNVPLISTSTTSTIGHQTCDISCVLPSLFVGFVCFNSRYQERHMTNVFGSFSNQLCFSLSLSHWMLLANQSWNYSHQHFNSCPHQFMKENGLTWFQQSYLFYPSMSNSLMDNVFTSCNGKKISQHYDELFKRNCTHRANWC